MRSPAFLINVQRLSILACLLGSIESHAQPPAAAVSITPAIVVAGSPELIRVDGPANASLDGEWLGRKLQFFRSANDRSWVALAGVDVEGAVGPSTLQLHLHFANKTTRDLTQTIEIHAAHYRTASISVEPKFIEPSPDQLQQIQAEQQIKDKAFSTSAPQPLWHGSFRAPCSRPAD